MRKVLVLILLLIYGSIADAQHITSQEIKDGTIATSDLSSNLTNDINKGVSAYGWGNHASVGYLTSLPQELNTSAIPTFAGLTLSADNISAEIKNRTFDFSGTIPGASLTFPTITSLTSLPNFGRIFGIETGSFVVIGTEDEGGARISLLNYNAANKTIDGSDISYANGIFGFNNNVVIDGELSVNSATIGDNSYPTTTGDNGQVLTTNGFGQLSWTTPVTSETDPVFTAWDKDYEDLTNRPIIPTATSDLINDSGFLTSMSESDPVWETEKEGYYTANEVDDLLSNVQVNLTFSDGLDLSGSNVTNTDKGSSAVTTHESTYNHGNYVDKSTNQTVDGVKTFSQIPVLPDTTPSQNLHIVSKQYADSIAAGFKFKNAVLVSSTSALPTCTYANGSSGVGATLTANANGAFPSIDGYSLSLNNRVLIKDQATASQNGIYTLTQAGDSTHPWILTRATDFDSDAEVDPGSSMLILNGNTYEATQWAQNAADPITIGSSSINFIQISKGQVYTAGSGLSEASGTFNVDLSDTNPSLEVSDGGLRAKVDDVQVKRSSSGLTLGASLGSANQVFGVNAAGSGVEYKSIQAGDNVTIENEPNVIRISSSGGGGGGGNGDYIYKTVEFHTHPASSLTLTNAAAALTAISYTNKKINLAGSVQYRIGVYQVTAGYAGTDINLEYSTNGTTYLPANNVTSAGELDIGTGVGVKVGTWADLASAAKDDVWLRLVSKDGDATADPAFRQVWVEFKVNSTVVDLASSDYAYEEISFASAPGTAQTWTNMPAALTELFGNAYSRKKFSLTNATQYRIVVNQAVAGYAGADFNLQYSTNNSTFLAADASNSGELDVGTGTGIKVGAWTDIVSGAKDDVYLRLVGKEGSGAVSPSFRQISVQFKQSVYGTGEGSSAAWGSITGTLSNQTDLNSALSGKESTLTFENSLNRNINTISLVNDSATPGNSKYYGTNSGGTRGYFDLPNSATWGSITGTLGNQTDLNSALAGKADSSHNHNSFTGNLSLGGNLTATGYVFGSSAILENGPYNTQILPSNSNTTNLHFTLPSNLGSAGQVLTSDGDANSDGTAMLSWSTPASAAAWGSITGTLSNQTDLNSALSAKQDTLTTSTSLVGGSLQVGSSAVGTEQLVKSYQSIGLAANRTSNITNNLFQSLYDLNDYTSTGQNVALSGDMRITGRDSATTSSGSWVGFLGQTVGTQFLSSIRGISGISQYSGTNTCDSAYGFIGQVNNGSTGTVGMAIGVYPTINNLSTGIITEASGVKIPNASNASGTITTFYGLKIDSLTAGGTNYSIHTGSADSYFGGNVNLASGKKYKINGTNLAASDVGAQPLDAQLTDVAGLTPTSGTVITGNGTNFVNSVSYSNAAGNNTLVQRSSAGYIYANYINLSGSTTTTAPSHIIVETGTDGFTRREPIANFKSNIALDTWGTPTDITTNNASTTYHGLLPKLSGSASQVLVGDGTWKNAVIPAGGYRDFVMAEGSVTHITLASAATYDASGNFKHWSFPKAATAVDTMVDFQFLMPPSYDSSHTLTALVFYRVSGATSGNVVMTSALKCVTSADAVSLESKAFATANSTTNAIPGTAGYGKSFTTTMTNKDSVAAGDECVLRILRDADNASDTTTATNYVQVTGVQLYWQ